MHVVYLQWHAIKFSCVSSATCEICAKQMRKSGDSSQDNQVYHSQCTTLQKLKDYLSQPKCTDVKKFWIYAPNHTLRCCCSSSGLTPTTAL